MRSSVSICLFFIAALSHASEAPAEFLLDAYALSEAQREGWEADVAGLNSFADVPQFVRPRSETENNALREIRGDLEAVCTLKAFADCQDYLREHRAAIHRSLPDNPEYWHAFWELLDSPRLLDLSFEPVDPAGGFTRLISTSYWWFYRDLLDDGRVEIDKMIRLQTAIRRWRTGYHSQYLGLVANAMQGIVLNQLSFAMAQASRDRDLDALARLTNAARPLTVEEMSWGPRLWMEREYFLVSIERILGSASDPEAELGTMLADREGVVDETVLAGIREDPASFVKFSSDVLAAHYIPLSTRSWQRYWAEGIPGIHVTEKNRLAIRVTAASAFAYTLSGERAANFALFLFDALADIYTGRVSPGMPSRAAPELWRWEWIRSPQPKICLVSNGIHRSTRAEPEKSNDRYCLDYYDEQRVAALYPQ